jgi:hypothetical protein
VVSSYSFPICNDDAETILHFLLECEYAKEAWLNSSVQHLCTMARPSSWSDLVDHVFQKLESPEIEIFFTWIG